MFTNSSDVRDRHLARFYALSPSLPARPYASHAPVYSDLRSRRVTEAALRYAIGFLGGTVDVSTL